MRSLAIPLSLAVLLLGASLLRADEPTFSRPPEPAGWADPTSNPVPAPTRPGLIPAGYFGGPSEMAPVGNAPSYASPAPPAATAYGCTCGDDCSGLLGAWRSPSRRLFESDHQFDDFVGPLTNPINSKDPRSLTEARILFVSDWGRPATPVIRGGNFQVYALQLRLALTDRLSLIADKDGIAAFHPAGKGTKDSVGLLNISAGLKYVLVRDVERKFLFTVGGQFEPPTGGANVFSGYGNGILGLFAIVGKEFGNKNHFLATVGQNIPMSAQNSGYFYTSLHLDKQLWGWLYPLVEANWLYYNESGRHLPPIGLEGDGLINLGTRNVVGDNFVTLAVGLKAQLNKHINTGIAYEFPVSERDFLLGNRIVADFIIRY
jgi:hypothetical protein